MWTLRKVRTFSVPSPKTHQECPRNELKNHDFWVLSLLTRRRRPGATPVDPENNKGLRTIQH